MAKLEWNVPGERFYETGVDRGVLYVNDTAVAWPGLVSVAESPTGGEARPYYIDGFKYLNVAAAEEFEATIEAYSYPPEFGQCNGVSEVQMGLFATQQPKKQFAFCYRTLIGNDIDGIDHGYKIHIVYNALAAPSSRSYATLSDSASAPTQSWSVTTMPPRMLRLKPTAHFVIDSRTTPENILFTIEAFLYGNDLEDARLPDATELMFMFSGGIDAGGINSTVTRFYDAGNPDTPSTLTLDGGSP